MFFLYCNQCFCLKSDNPSMELNVSKCGHILCMKCVKSKCAVCHRSYQARKIGNGMPASSAIYFEDTTKIFRRYQKIVKFQAEQEAFFYHNTVQKTPRKLQKTLGQYRSFLKLKDRFDAQAEREKNRITKMKEYISYFERQRLRLRTKRDDLPSELFDSQSVESRPSTPALSVIDSSATSGSSAERDAFASHEDFTM